ncbi:MAG: hypothetical protein FJW26_07605 [Acidimicrobiia bacterium]|nr:hypothetical protein [Acidimicrobiia bacterium]
MAYCPECGAEFGGGIRRCPECGVDLLEELKDPSLDDSSNENLVIIQESAGQALAAKITETLGQHGILPVVEDATHSKGQSTAKAARILVSQKDEARARQLLSGLADQIPRA